MADENIENTPKKRNIIQAYSETSLILRIVIGLLIGIALAFIFPVDGPEWSQGVGDVITLLGNLFVSALRAVAPILVFFLVISALMSAKAPKSMRVVIVLYIISTLVAAIVAFIGTEIMNLIAPIHLELSVAGDVEQTAPSGVGEVLTNIIMNIVANPVDALANGNFIGILTWAILIGIALRHVNQNVKDFFTSVSDAISQIVRWIINLAPFGIMGLVYTSVATSGIKIFSDYGMLIILLVICMLIIAFITNPILVFICTRENPYPLILVCLKDSGITAFFTRSSAANIPVNMELCRKLGLNKDNYSVSIPLGATINMAGAAVTITVMTMAAVFTVGLSVDPLTAVLLCVLSAVSACGASGVAGGSLLLIPLACSLFGLDATVAFNVVSIGFIIGVIQDSCETALNSSSDVVFTATAEYMEMRKNGIEYKLGKDAFSKDEVA